jgi:dipeptidyl aminopeptidase/acylaminoacyl peptidase
MQGNSVGVFSVALAATLLLLGGATGAQRSSGSGPSMLASKPATSDPARFELTVDGIMRGPDLVGYPPSGLRWSADSQTLYFDWRKPGEERASTYAVAHDGGGLRRLSDDDVRNIPPSAGGRWDKARRRVLFVDDGDIVIVGADGVRRQITRTNGAESSPRWARNDTHVTWVREGNLFIAPVDPGGSSILTQLTDVAPRRVEPRLTDSQRFIRDEEEKLIDFVEKQKAERKRTEEEQKKNKLPAFELQDRQSVADLLLSPDGTYVFVVVAERPAGVKNTIVPNYVTATGYTEDIQARSNVGDTQDRRLLAVLNLKSGKSVWADGSFAPPTDEPKSSPPSTPGSESEGRPGRKPEREIRWSTPIVSEDGAAVIATARSADNKDRWIVKLDPESGKTTVIDHLHDDAWVRDGGMGGGGLEFLPGSRTIAYLSERDGWMHLYALDAAADGAKPRQLTSGRWEVASVELARSGKKLYLTTSEEHPGERHLYTVPLDGGARTKITSMSGSNIAEVSPDESTLGLIHSYSTKPPEVFVMPNAPAASAKQITTTPTEAWRAFKWIDPKVVTFKARDGVDVYARLFTPEMIGARRDPARPAVVFVHGAGYLQNAHKYWSTYFREYMFHNLLAARGYVVLDVDYRASAGYGRDWRTAIYRHMGGKDLEDIVDGARYLTSAEKVDPKRIGVYGGSYGGFITLMAMFTTPDVFAAGAALRPVTDWAHYNHGYTSNILNVPQKDAEAYRKSSPIYFAEGLKGALLICHGMVDVNVENHGFTEASSWADEYKRILKLFDERLRTRGGKVAD